MENTRTDKGTQVASLVRFSHRARYTVARCKVATTDSVQQLAVIFNVRTVHGIVKPDSHIACRAHAVPLPCPAAKGLECVFPI